MPFRSDDVTGSVASWWPKEFDNPRAFRFHVVLDSASSGVDFEDQEEAERVYRQTEHELREVTDADRVYVGWANTYMGADGLGLGAILQFLATWADVITVAGALTLWKNKILTVVERLKSKFGQPEVYLSVEALSVLVLADIAHTDGLDPLEVQSIQHVVETAVPMERRAELQHMYACYAITVSAPDSEGSGGLSVWCYFVTSLGHVIARGRQSVPYQQDPSWRTVETPGTKLNGLS